MPHYVKLGEVPHKRHTQFRKPNGQIYSEELVSTEGFSDVYSLVYHVHPPTAVQQIDDPVDVSPQIAEQYNMRHRCYKGFQIAQESDYLKSRKTILANTDCHISLAAPTNGLKDVFYKNSSADELIFIHQGNGKLLTLYGEISFRYGDYLVIPRGTVYQIHFETTENRLFIVESFSPIRYPKRYCNRFGQLLEHAPYCERDIRTPEHLKTFDQEGDFLIYIKKEGKIYPYHYRYHPFDAIGWDGYHYPFAFSIHDFEPITGRVHQPPPVHQTFEAHNFVVCSFVPRKYDYHPLAVPAPYFHSNVDSDEVLYYVDGDFMSRKHVEKGMITLHPIGIPHGPHPGAIERSLGQEETRELAVMVDTFRPLWICKDAEDIEDKDYYKSWL
ncbi:MAG: homogentisate 1,2-dioxygenase [Chitinophagales bacterium]|nr:homogentisate 1,2-dioxygenase [Chitinophagales bacterium]MDW8273576.1 homogentisate 1,2-dioxygenase [Chitinophagales bacterium]